jgi:hypothetical protein
LDSKLGAPVFLNPEDIFMRTRLQLLTLVCLLLPMTVAADSQCGPASSDCVEVGTWQVSVSLGAGVRTNPVMGNKDIPLIVLPEISYSGQRFFLQNLDFGFILTETQTQQLNLLLTPSYEQVYFHRWSPGNFILDSQVLLTTPTDVQGGIENADSGRNNFGESQIEIDMSRLPPWADWNTPLPLPSGHCRRTGYMTSVMFIRAVKRALP